METSTKKRKAAPQAPASVEKKGPVKTVRVDDVSASIWSRIVEMKGQPTLFYSVTFERSYRDSTGGWKYTRFFDVNDLGKIAACAQEAGAYIGSLVE
jgi:hypothetical protein